MGSMSNHMLRCLGCLWAGRLGKERLRKFRRIGKFCAAARRIALLPARDSSVKRSACGLCLGQEASLGGLFNGRAPSSKEVTRFEKLSNVLATGKVMTLETSVSSLNSGIQLA